MRLACVAVVSLVVGAGCAESPGTGAAGNAASVVMNGQGEMAGEVTATSVILQSRLTSVNALVDGDVAGAPGVAQFEIASSQDFANAQKTEWLKAVPERDFTVRTRVQGLTPGARHYYRVRYGPEEQNVRVGPTRSFKTLPGANAAVEVNFVVVTGMNYNAFYRGSRAYKGPDRALGYPALKTILDATPDFFVGTGDNVYYDSGPKDAQKPDELRRYWHEQFVQPRMVDLMGQVASYWEKDDHDSRYNDSDSTGPVEPSQELGSSIFLEQMPVVDPADPNPLPYRTHRVSKDLQIWLVEGRDYRSANMSEDPNKTLWGAEQLRWLKQTLLESNATFKILISPTPMVGPDDINRAEFGGTRRPGAQPPPPTQAGTPSARAEARLKGQDDLKRDNMSNAAGFRRERDEFFAWLRENGLLKKNFYVICGDRHWQYYSIDPSGVEEFSTGAIIDENSPIF